MFEKIIEESKLRYRWSGSTAIDTSWRFIEYTSRRGELYVRIDEEPWTFYKKTGVLASTSEAESILGRKKTAERVIKEKIAAKATVKKTCTSGNPYGRFPEGVEMAILGEYSSMEGIDFLDLADGLGLRILDEGFLEIYKGAPETLTDEWDREWKRVGNITAYRPWALYARGEVEVSAPSADNIKAIASAYGLPDVNNAAVTMTLDKTRFEVISTLDRKAFSSQKTVMKNNSANEVAAILGLPAVGYEWLHLIAFSLGGFEGTAQTPDNLILGTAAANTAMMLLEGFAKEVLKGGRYRDATIAVIKTGAAPSCRWFATQIHYTVKFSKGSGLMPFWVREQFNPLSTIAPNYGIKEMVQQLSSHELKSQRPPMPVGDTMRSLKKKSGGRRL